MPISVEDREEIRNILHETIMKDHEIFDDLLKNVRKFRESPEGRLAVVETNIIEIKEDIKELKSEIKEMRGEINGFKKEVKEEMAALRKEFKDDIKELRQDLRYLILWLFGIMSTLYGGLIIYLINKMGS